MKKEKIQAWIKNPATPAFALKLGWYETNTRTFQNLNNQKIPFLEI